MKTLDEAPRVRKRVSGGAVEQSQAVARAMSDLQVEREIGWLFADIHRLLGQRFGERVQGLGLTRAQWRVLFTAKRFEGRTQTELADQLEIERAPVGRTLDKLESGGWIARRADPKDGRINRIYCTAKIIRFMPSVVAASKNVIGEALADLSASQIVTLIGQLSAIKANLDIPETR